MKSPITGKEMVLKKEIRILSFRKESFEVIYHFYYDPETGESFVDDTLETLNITQVYNKYRERFRLPFPDETREIRNKYGISARKMSDILGFGPNTYSNYEKGEIPGKANGRLILLAADPEEFHKLADYSGNLTPQLEKKIGEAKNRNTGYNDLFSLITKRTPNRFTGYRMMIPDKVYQMVCFFAEALQPWKTKLNKLLFYADFLYYKHHGFSISGLQYAAIDHGPVPDNYEVLLSSGQKKGFFDVEYKAAGRDFIGEKIIPPAGRRFDPGLFTEEEIESMKIVSKHFKNISATDLVKMSHEEKAWQENIDEKGLIDYTYGFDLINI